MVTPILDGRLKKRLAEEVLQLQLADNQRTWLLEKDTYTRIVKKPSEKSVNAQEELIRRYGE